MDYRFGIYPENKTPELWWGARAIITTKEIDIPMGRQNFEGNREHEGFYDFFEWLNDTAIPYLNDCIKKGNTNNLHIDSDCGCYHCEADDRMSGGYLYIGAWTV